MKPYKDLTAEQKTAIDVTADFWKEAAETGITKQQWSRYDELCDYVNECGFCECTDEICYMGQYRCPLFLFVDLMFCGYFCSWYNAKDEEQKLYAKIIYYLIESYRKGRSWKS